MRHRASCVETRSSPDLLGANVRALTFYLGNPFPRFLFSLLKSYAGAIADGDGEQWHYREAFGAHSLRTKRSVMFSSLKKLTKSRCGTSKTRPEAVSILNGLFLVISSSIRDASIQLRCFPFEYARPHCDCENRAGDGSHSRGYNIHVNSWLNQRWFRRGP